MNEKNIVDSLCDSIENNPRITDYNFIDKKSGINWDNRGMSWTIYAGVELKDKETDIDTYIKNMNDFMESFKFVHEEKILEPDYTKFFTKTGRRTMMRGEKGYEIRNIPIIEQKIGNWPEPTLARAINLLKLDRIHVSMDFIIRPSLSSSHMQPEIYDRPVILEKYMNTNIL